MANDESFEFESMLEHVCGLCEKVFQLESELDEHILLSHPVEDDELDDTEDIMEDEDAEQQRGDNQQVTEYAEQKNEEDQQENEMMKTFKEELAMDVSDIKREFREKKGRRLNIGKKFFNMYVVDRDNNLWTCSTCEATFHSDHGMRHHLKSTRCGFGTRDDYKPKRNYKDFYMKEEDKLICCGCGFIYYSEHGMYYHLKSTTCGFGSREKAPANKDYTPFYTFVDNYYSCIVCELKYDSIRGIHRHLQEKCGVDAKPKVTPKPERPKKPKVKRNKEEYEQFFRKNDDESTYICNGCESVYQSTKGIHSHLDTTYCGFGDRYRSAPKACYLDMYRKSEGHYICLRCDRSYTSNKGVLSHLKVTKCGYGDKDYTPPRRSYALMYVKDDDGQFVCKRCSFKGSYMQAMHRHLRTCAASFLEELQKLGDSQGSSDSDYINQLGLEEQMLLMSNNDRRFLEELRNFGGFQHSPKKEMDEMINKPVHDMKKAQIKKEVLDMSTSLKEKTQTEDEKLLMTPEKVIMTPEKANDSNDLVEMDLD